MDTVILNNGVEMPMLGIRTRNMAEDECEEAVAQALAGLSFGGHRPKRGVGGGGGTCHSQKRCEPR